jgi:Spy/CpxP family protein refolding chaperone
MKSRVAVLLALVVVFVAGAAAGGAYGWREGFRQAMRRPPPSDMKKHVVDGLQRDLLLTAEQRAKIEPIVAETAAKIGELHRNSGQQMRDLIKGQNVRFKEFLDPVQWEKLQELEKKRWHRHNTDTNRPPSP